MQATKHFHHRMSQRGVSADMVRIVLDYGTVAQDKFILGRKEAARRLSAIEGEMRVLKKIIDKGGVTVVADGEALITAYNCPR